MVFFKPKKQNMEGYYEVNINFEEASKEWNKNKKRVDQSYIYICGLTTKKGTCCQNKRYKDQEYCYIHRKYK